MFSDFVQASLGASWSWGRVDCTIWVADWCLRRWGVDPAADLRGSYETEEGADNLIRNAGGLIRLVSPRMTFLLRAVDPADGAVGIIEILGRQTSAVMTGGKWAFRTPRGIGVVGARPLVAWGD